MEVVQQGSLLYLQNNLLLFAGNLVFDRSRSVQFEYDAWRQQVPVWKMIQSNDESLKKFFGMTLAANAHCYIWLHLPRNMHSERQTKDHFGATATSEGESTRFTAACLHLHAEQSDWRNVSLSSLLLASSSEVAQSRRQSEWGATNVPSRPKIFTQQAPQYRVGICRIDTTVSKALSVDCITPRYKSSPKNCCNHKSKCRQWKTTWRNLMKHCRNIFCNIRSSWTAYGKIPPLAYASGCKCHQQEQEHQCKKDSKQFPLLLCKLPIWWPTFPWHISQGVYNEMYKQVQPIQSRILFVTN